MSGTLKLPTPTPQYDRGDQAAMRGAIERSDQHNVKRGAAQPAVYLTATDDGSTMKGTVNSAGVMTWTVVARA